MGQRRVYEVSIIALVLIFPLFGYGSILNNFLSIFHNNAEPSGNSIYLTLDADMSQKMFREYKEHKVSEWYDPRIFQYLESNKIPTTFFVSGLFAKTYPGLIKSLAGYPFFSIQNHSYDESSFVPGCFHLATLNTSEQKFYQIKKTQDVLDSLTGYKPTLFRYPGLCHTGPADDALVEKLGLKIAAANVIAGDPFSRNTQAIIGNVLKRAFTGGVIIMHIGGPDAPASFDALQEIVPKLKQMGYYFKKL